MPAKNRLHVKEKPQSQTIRVCHAKVQVRFSPCPKFQSRLAISSLPLSKNGNFSIVLVGLSTSSKVLIKQTEPSDRGMFWTKNIVLSSKEIVPLLSTILACFLLLKRVVALVDGEIIGQAERETTLHEIPFSPSWPHSSYWAGVPFCCRLQQPVLYN